MDHISLIFFFLIFLYIIVCACKIFLVIVFLGHLFRGRGKLLTAHFSPVHRPHNSFPGYTADCHSHRHRSKIDVLPQWKPMPVSGLIISKTWYHSMFPLYKKKIYIYTFKFIFYDHPALSKPHHVSLKLLNTLLNNIYTLLANMLML